MNFRTLLLMDAVGVLFLVLISHLVYIITMVLGFIFSIIGTPPPQVLSLGKVIPLAVDAFAAVLVIATLYSLFTAIRGEE